MELREVGTMSDPAHSPADLHLVSLMCIEMCSNCVQIRIQGIQ